ncbi:MAG: radical SAM protein [Lachnospiraceae bacterium]|nr:radical SAM protein [Lachnospiraceae bacterium]
MKNRNLYEKCNLCPRGCGVDRLHGKMGVCGVSSTLRIARAALHFWEEPCISGTKGSGAVFFSGCSLHCIFCQNEPIAQGVAGKDIPPQRLAEIFLELQEKGANNINLVTPGQYVPHIVEAVEEARNQGLCLPIVYNTGGYECVDTLKMLEGIVDVYLPDFKYMDEKLAEQFSHGADYPMAAKAAVAEMVRQKPQCLFYPENTEGKGQPCEYSEYKEGTLIGEGVIVRQLLLPGHLKDAKAVTGYLHETYGNRIYLSMMSQYTPLSHGKTGAFPELQRRLTHREYERFVDYAIALGVERAFVQEGKTAEESFIPDFSSGEGV